MSLLARKCTVHPITLLFIYAQIFGAYLPNTDLFHVQLICVHSTDDHQTSPTSLCLLKASCSWSHLSTLRDPLYIFCAKNECVTWCYLQIIAETLYALVTVFSKTRRKCLVYSSLRVYNSFPLLNDLKRGGENKTIKKMQWWQKAKIKVI